MTTLSSRLRKLLVRWAQNQYELVAASAELADSDVWVRDGSPSAAHWLAEIADVETCTTREWIRIGRQLRLLHATADAWANGDISFSKVRALTRFATPDNELELLGLARSTTANHLPRALAAWLSRTAEPGQLEAHQRGRRSVVSRLEPDGMTIVTLRLPPLQAAVFDAVLTAAVMRCRPSREPDGSWPTLAQQRADAFQQVLKPGAGEDGEAGEIVTELVIHIRGDGCTLNDGTPVPQFVVERLAPHAFLRALIHDAEGHPIDASNRRRHPTTRQKRVVHEKCNGACVDCGRTVLLEYDHDPEFEQTGRTITKELVLRCAPCHRKRHRSDRLRG